MATYVLDGWARLGDEITITNPGQFYPSKLSGDGLTVAVADSYEDPLGRTNAGTLRLYEWSSGAWTRKGQDLFGWLAYDYYGGQSTYMDSRIALSNDGNVVAWGSKKWSDDGGANYPGRVDVYEYCATGTCDCQCYQCGSAVPHNFGSGSCGAESSTCSASRSGTGFSGNS